MSYQNPITPSGQECPASNPNGQSGTGKPSITFEEIERLLLRFDAETAMKLYNAFDQTLKPNDDWRNYDVRIQNSILQKRREETLEVKVLASLAEKAAAPSTVGQIVANQTILGDVSGLETLLKNDAVKQLLGKL